MQHIEAEVLAERPPRVTRPRIIAAAASVLIVAALLAWVLPWATGASWSGIAASLAALSPAAIVTVTGLGLVALLLEAVAVRAAVPGSHYPAVARGHAASQALTLAVPGGGMLGVGLLGWILRRTGLGLGVIITGLIAASLVEMAISSILVPLVGLGAYALSSVTAGPGPDLPATFGAAFMAIIGSVIALGLMILALQRRVLAGVLDQLGTLVDLPVTAILAQRDQLIRLLRRRPVALVGPVLAARIAQWAALVIAVDATGADVPILMTVAIFALGRVLSLIPLTPGGAGITETVGAAVLVALGVGAEQSAVAMLLFAVAMLVVPLIGGTIAGVLVLLRRGPAPTPAG